MTYDSFPTQSPVNTPTFLTLSCPLSPPQRNKIKCISRSKGPGLLDHTPSMLQCIATAHYITSIDSLQPQPATEEKCKIQQGKAMETKDNEFSLPLHLILVFPTACSGMYAFKFNMYNNIPPVTKMQKKSKKKGAQTTIPARAIPE